MYPSTATEMKFRFRPANAQVLPHFPQCSRKEISGVLNYWDSSREILSWPAFVSIIYISHRNAWLWIIWIA